MDGWSRLSEDLSLLRTKDQHLFLWTSFRFAADGRGLGPGDIPGRTVRLRGHVCAWHTRKDQRTTWWNQFSLSTMWDWGHQRQMARLGGTCLNLMSHFRCLVYSPYFYLWSLWTFFFLFNIKATLDPSTLLNKKRKRKRWWWWWNPS